MNREQLLGFCQSFGSSIESKRVYRQKPLIMGILNVTPDSFFDGGLYRSVHDAKNRAAEMIKQGADLIDVGGASSRPGADVISTDEELARVMPVISELCESAEICVSIDTYNPAVMEAAVLAGAGLINDIKALTEDGALLMAKRLQVPVCLMHMQGVPQTMQINPHYSDDVVFDIDHFFETRIEACLQAGIPRAHLILDPGFGFGKSVSHNLELVKRLGEFSHHQLPLMLGVSEKSTIGAVLQSKSRSVGGLATEIFATLQGVSMIRTHDVEKTNQALRMIDAIVGGFIND